MDGIYKSYAFFHLNNWDYNNQEKKYPNELIEIHKKIHYEDLPGFYLYLDMKYLSLDGYGLPSVHSEYENDYIFTEELIENWVICHSASYLWYCLVHCKSDYERCFNIYAIKEYQQQEIKDLANKIDHEKFRDVKFGVELLGGIGGQFESKIFPRLLKLTKANNRGLDKQTQFMLYILISIIIIGVIFPLILSSFAFNVSFLFVTTMTIVWAMIVTITIFVLEFERVLMGEIKFLG